MCDVYPFGFMYSLINIFMDLDLTSVDKHSPWVPGILMFCSTGTLVAFSLEAQHALKSSKNALVAQNSSTREQNLLLMGVGLGLAAITELITTTVLLRKLSIPDTHFKKTQSLLRRLILWLTTRCFLVTANQIIFLIVYITQQSTLDWLPFLMLEPKLHVVTILAMLNSRIQQDIESRTDGIYISTSSALNLGSKEELSHKMSVADRCHSAKPKLMHFSISDSHVSGKHGDIMNVHPEQASQISQDFTSFEGNPAGC